MIFSARRVYYSRALLVKAYLFHRSTIVKNRESKSMQILITGAAGFIGFHLALRLLESGYEVVGLDNLNDYYSISLKKARLARLLPYKNFKFVQMDLSDREGISRTFASHSFDRVVNLAAQAGVRYSLTNPHVYIHSNILGFLNVLEGCRYTQVKHLLFASSSSVYGANTNVPYSVHRAADHPISLYAATKKSNELIAHSYSHLYGVACTGLRFFTVYGPWGRPDMSIYLFIKAILKGEPIDVFNYGQHKRDFTYIDDVIEGVVRLLSHFPESDPNWSGLLPDPASSQACYRLYNIGNNSPVELMLVIELIEKILGRTAHKNLLPMQPGDVPETSADVDDLKESIAFKPSTLIEVGIRRCIEWYLDYYEN